MFFDLFFPVFDRLSSTECYKHLRVVMLIHGALENLPRGYYSSAMLSDDPAYTLEPLKLQAVLWKSLFLRSPEQV